MANSVRDQAQNVTLPGAGYSTGSYRDRQIAQLRTLIVSQNKSYTDTWIEYLTTYFPAATGSISDKIKQAGGALNVMQ